MTDAHLFPGEINLLDIGDRHPRMAQHFSEWLDDVRHTHVAAGHFVKHRREEDKVFLGNQHKFDVRRACQLPLMVQRRKGTAKTAAENQDGLLPGGLRPGR